jgi:hypothetical protein
MEFSDFQCAYATPAHVDWHTGLTGRLFMDRRIPVADSLCRLRTLALGCVILLLMPGVKALGQNAHYLGLNREGTASVILAEDTKTALIVDGGQHTSDASALKLDGQPLLQYLYSHGYRNIVILCSHPHSDHVGGLLDIIHHKKSQPDDIDLRDFSTVVLVDSGHPHETSLKAAFKETHGAAAADGVHYVSADKQNAFDDPVLKKFFGSEMNVQVSNFVYEPRPGSGVHGRSIVTHIRLSRPGSNDSTLLIDFDDADDYIIRAWAAVAPDILPKATKLYVVAPHHNSDYTNTAPLLDLHTQGKVKFDGLVITASGRRAISFGHPGVQNYLRWGTTLGGVNGVHVTGGVGTVTVTENGVAPLDIAGRKNTLERVLLPLASRHEAKAQQLTEQALAPADRFPPARLEDELKRCGLNLTLFATRIGVRSDAVTSWIESDGTDSALSGRIFQEVRTIKEEKKKNVHDANAHAIAMLSLALSSDGTLPPPGSTEGPVTSSPTSGPKRPPGSPSGSLALARKLGPDAFNRNRASGDRDWPEDPPIGDGTPNGGPRAPRPPPSAPGEGSRRFKVLSDEFQKSLGTLGQGQASGLSERQRRFNFSSSGRPIFGGVIVGNQVTGPTVDLLKVKIRLVSGDDDAVGDEFAEDELVEIGILVDGADGQRWYFADVLTQTELWTAYHFVRPLAEWRDRYGVSDHECNLVGMQRDVDDAGEDEWTFGIHPAIEHTALSRDCMMMDMLISQLLKAAPPAGDDLRTLLESIDGKYLTYQWYDVASRVTLAGESVDVIPADSARTSLLGVRAWGCENARRTTDDLVVREKAIVARAATLDARQKELLKRNAAGGVSQEEALAFKSDVEKFKSDAKTLREEGEAFQARCGALKFDDARFCKECVLRLPIARRFERFARTVALLRWIEEKNPSAFPRLPDGIVCLQGDVPAKMSNKSVSEMVQQTAFSGPLYFADTAIDRQSPTYPKSLVYASSVFAIGAAGLVMVIWIYQRRRNLARDNAVARGVPVADDDPVVVEDAKVVVSCPKCSQRVRIPRELGTLVVTCPKCKHKWDYVPL